MVSVSFLFVFSRLLMCVDELITLEQMDPEHQAMRHKNRGTPSFSVMQASDIS